jgi:hypothetical protein
MVELYLHSSIYLHGIVLNYIIKCEDNYLYPGIFTAGLRKTRREKTLRTAGISVEI